MTPLTQDDLVPYGEYEQLRVPFRQRIIELKQRRRLAVGDKVTLVFENRDTVRFQIQEMIRAERIVDPVKVQNELDVYNALLPQDGGLSATMFIEITESDHVKEDLDAFQGIDRGRTVALRCGGHAVFGEFETGHSQEDKISAVHFIRFRPGDEFRKALAGSTTASVEICHPAYQTVANVPAPMRQEWLVDLGVVAGSPGS